MSAESFSNAPVFTGSVHPARFPPVNRQPKKSVRLPSPLDTWVRRPNGFPPHAGHHSKTGFERNYLNLASEGFSVIHDERTVRKYH